MKMYSTYHIVRQILIQVGQRIRVRAETLVLTAQTISSSNLSLNCLKISKKVIFSKTFSNINKISPEFDQIDHVEGTNMISPSGQMLGPIATAPKPESIHRFATVAERGVAVKNEI